MRPCRASGRRFRWNPQKSDKERIGSAIASEQALGRRAVLRVPRVLAALRSRRGRVEVRRAPLHLRRPRRSQRPAEAGILVRETPQPAQPIDGQLPRSRKSNRRAGFRFHAVEPMRNLTIRRQIARFESKAEQPGGFAFGADELLLLLLVEQPSRLVRDPSSKSSVAHGATPMTGRKTCRLNCSASPSE
jgi:hypothetical protein